MKSCPTSLTVREMQIKTTVNYLTPFRAATIKKSESLRVRKDVEKSELLCTVGGMQKQARVGNRVVAPPPKRKNRIAIWFHKLTSGYKPRRTESRVLKRYLHIHAYAECCKIAKRWKRSKYPPADERMNKMWYVHTMEYHSTSRKKEVLIHAAVWVNFWGQCAKGHNPATKKANTVWFQFYEVLRRPVIHRDRKQNGGSKGRRGRREWCLIHGSRVSFLWDEKSSVDGLRWW